MGTNLITADAAAGLNAREIAAMIGQQTPGGGSDINSLGINRDHEDADGNAVPAGTYKFTGLEGNCVYGKPVNFRPMLQAFQYRVFDDNEEKYTNQSVVFLDFKHDAPDERGGNKCGKLPRKVYADLSKEKQAIQDQIKCTRLLFGQVTFDGVDNKGQKQGLVSMPVLWRHGGSAFIPVDEAIKSLNKGGATKLMFNYIFQLDTERAKKGSNVYYIPVITVDRKNVVEFTNADFDMLKGFKEYIKGINESIMKRHTKASASRVITEEDGAMVEEVLGRDFDDELPSQLKDTTIVSAG